MSERLNKLYQETIRQESKAPYHFEKRNLELELEAYNPFCGDQYQLFLGVRDARIEEAYFYGYGCSISKASTSVLIRKLEGLSLEEALGLSTHFFQQLAKADIKAEAPYAAFAFAQQFPGRAQCATLSWESLQQYLRQTL